MKVLSPLLLTLLVAGLLLGACQDPRFGPAPVKKRAYLHVLHANPQLEAVDLQLISPSGNRPVTENLNFGQAWPPNGYASLLTTDSFDVHTGLGRLELSLLAHASRDTLVPRWSADFKPNKYRSVYLVDSLGKAILSTSLDQIESPPPGEAFVRFMNFDYKHLSVSLQAKSDTFKTEGTNFLTYSSFKRIRAGEYSFYFMDDFAEIKLDSVTQVDIKPGGIYNFFLMIDGSDPIGAYEILDQ